MKSHQRVWAAVVAWAGVLCTSSTAFNITLDYPPGFLFSATHDATAKAAINQAAADLSAAITTNLSAINTDVYSATNGNAQATFDWKFEFTNPTTGGTSTIDVATIPSNTVIMHVGSRNISSLGVGGPGGAGGGVNFSYNPENPSQVVGAVANAEAQTESAYKRGGGPIIGAASGSGSAGSVPVNYSVDYGVAHGSLTLDWNGAGDGGWHFNHTTQVASGKNDLYSVALHEILHALGFGTSKTWEDRRSGSNWTGASAIAEHGTGNGLVSGGHITETTFSTNAYNGSPQEAVMDPNLTTGTRKVLTALDLAFLRDLGYNTIDWADPSTLPDFDDDGDVDGRDFLVWQRGGSPSPLSAGDLADWRANYGASGLAAFVVPEPTAGVLLLLSLPLLGSRHGSR